MKVNVFKLVFLQKISFDTLKYALFTRKNVVFFLACLRGLFSFSCDAITSISVYFSLLMRCKAPHLCSPARVFVFFSVVSYDFAFILIIHPQLQGGPVIYFINIKRNGYINSKNNFIIVVFETIENEFDSLYFILYLLL
jgi:hypothetical protein